MLCSTCLKILILTAIEFHLFGSQPLIIWEETTSEEISVSSWTTFDLQETIDVSKFSCSGGELLLSKEDMLYHIGKIQQQLDELKVLATKNRIKVPVCCPVHPKCTASCDCRSYILWSCGQ